MDIERKGEEDRVRTEDARSYEGRSASYAPGIRPAAGLAALVAVMVGGGAGATMLWILPSFASTVSRSDVLQQWIRMVGAALPAPYLVLIGFFIALLVVWQLENAVQARAMDSQAIPRRARASVGYVALFFVGPISVFLLVWVHTGVWASGASGRQSAEAIVATCAALFVVYLASEVAVAPSPNAFQQLAAKQLAVERERFLLVSARRVVGSTSRASAMAQLVGRCVVIATVPALAAGAIAEAFIVGGQFALEASVVAAASTATLFGVLCMGAARVGLRGARGGVLWLGWVYAWFWWLAVFGAHLAVWVISGEVSFFIAGWVAFVVAVAIAVETWPGGTDETSFPGLARLLLVLRAGSLPRSIASFETEITRLRRATHSSSSYHPIRRPRLRSHARRPV